MIASVQPVAAGGAQFERAAAVRLGAAVGSRHWVWVARQAVRRAPSAVTRSRAVPSPTGACPERDGAIRLSRACASRRIADYRRKPSYTIVSTTPATRFKPGPAWL